MPDDPQAENERFEIETFPNPAPHRDYVIVHTTPEFTSVCPKTGQPDFATIDLEYVPGETCIELKSLKLYYYSKRNVGMFYERATNLLLDELAAACSPRWMRVTARWNVRGGIGSVLVAETAPRPGHLPPLERGLAWDKLPA